MAEKLRRELLRLSVSGSVRSNSSGVPNLRRIFREFDRDQDGRLDHREFRRALEDLGFQLTTGEVRRLLSRFDCDGDGQISYADFVDFVEDSPSASNASSGNDYLHHGLPSGSNYLLIF